MSEAKEQTTERRRSNLTVFRMIREDIAKPLRWGRNITLPAMSDALRPRYSRAFLMQWMDAVPPTCLDLERIGRIELVDKQKSSKRFNDGNRHQPYTTASATHKELYTRHPTLPKGDVLPFQSNPIAIAERIAKVRHASILSHQSLFRFETSE